MTQQEKEIEANNLLARSEYRFRGFLVAVTLCLVIVAIVLQYNTKNQILTDNQNTRQLIRCSISAFTPEHYENANTILSDCLKSTKVD